MFHFVPLYYLNLRWFNSVIYSLKKLFKLTRETSEIQFHLNSVTNTLEYYCKKHGSIYLKMLRETLVMILTYIMFIFENANQNTENVYLTLSVRKVYIYISLQEQAHIWVPTGNLDIKSIEESLFYKWKIFQIKEVS